MSSVSALETLIDDVKKAFAEAKSDGKLEAAEVIQIAGDVAKKVFLIGTGTLVEKKALILHALQKGLAAAGGLQGLDVLKVAGPAGLAAAEKQILGAAMASVESLLNVAPQLFEPVRGCLSALKGPLSKLLPFCSQAASMAAALSPKDAKLIQEALQMMFLMRRYILVYHQVQLQELFDQVLHIGSRMSILHLIPQVLLSGTQD
jgi:hypothetical protein